MKIEIINPITYKDWDDLLLTSDQSTFFQTSAWARVLCESYNYKPRYLVTKDGDRLSSLIPVMEIKSFLTGKRGISLPFTDFCSPISESDSQLNATTQALIEYGKKAGWKHLEFRGGGKYFDESCASEKFITHSLDLIKDEKAVSGKLRDSTFRNIKHAQKENVRVTFNNTWNSVEAYYKLHCFTRKIHGLPPQPEFFFRKIFEHIISRGKGFVSLALWKDKPVAGAVFFHFGKKAIFKYGASDPKYHHLRPNNLLLWETIKRYLKDGYKYFSFGKTEPENSGLLQFKRGWGTRERIIYYYKYDLTKDAFLNRKRGFKTSYYIVKKFPIPLLKLAGTLLYRHVG